MDITLTEAIKVACFIGALVAFLCLERLYPYAKRPLIDARHLIRNSVFVLTTVLMSRWWIVPLSLAATQSPVGRGVALPEPLLLLVHFALLDLALYGWHRLSHEVPFLWRFHQVHHLDTKMDASTALRFHFGELFFSALFRCGVIMLLAIPFSHVLLFEAFTALCIFFHHSNIRLPKKVEKHLNPYFITPALHWMHHHKKQAHTDSNYGISTTAWDRIFGTYTKAARTPDMPLGVEGTHGDTDIFELMLKPFHKQNTKV